MHNFNITEFLKYKAKLDNALCEAAAVDNDGVIKLTGRGEIAGKSIISAQEKFFEKIFGKITPEEAFIIKNIIEKISSDF